MKSVLWGAAAALAVVASPAWAELKIGYVDYQRLMQEAPQAQAVQASLRNEFLPRQQAIVKEQQQLKTRADAFQRNAATMTDDQRDREQKELRDEDRDLQAKQSEFQDDLNARKQEVLTRLQQNLDQAVQEYARAQGFDLVLAGNLVLYHTNTMDLTAAVLARLQGSSDSTGAAPRARKSSSPPRSQ